MRLITTTQEATRKTLARILRYRLKGDIDDATARTLISGFNTMLGYWKLEADLRIEERLDRLEEQLQNAPRRSA